MCIFQARARAAAVFKSFPSDSHVPPAKGPLSTLTILLSPPWLVFPFQEHLRQPSLLGHRGSCCGPPRMPPRLHGSTSWGLWKRCLAVTHTGRCRRLQGDARGRHGSASQGAPESPDPATRSVLSAPEHQRCLGLFERRAPGAAPDPGIRIRIPTMPHVIPAHLQVGEALLWDTDLQLETTSPSRGQTLALEGCESHSFPV